MIGLLVAWYFILVGIIAWMLKHPDDDIQLLGWILVGIMGIVFLIYVVKKSLMGA